MKVATWVWPGTKYFRMVVLFNGRKARFFITKVLDEGKVRLCQLYIDDVAERTATRQFFSSGIRLDDRDDLARRYWKLIWPHIQDWVDEAHTHFASGGAR